MAAAYWRVANNPTDWDLVAKEMEAVHEIGLDSSDTRYRLASAYAKKERWADAVIQFSLLEGRRLPERLEPRRHFNYALALKHTGQISSAKEQIASFPGDWPKEIWPRVKELSAILSEPRAD